MDEPEGKLAWKQLRKGVADLHRRAEVSQRSNERYLDALSTVDDTSPCSRLFDAVARPVLDGGRRFRALRIGDPDDLRLLEAICRGELVTSGFRNQDIRRLTDPVPPNATPIEKRRAAAKVSRRLRLLRAHGLIRKAPKTHRYFITKRGELLTNTNVVFNVVPVSGTIYNATAFFPSHERQYRDLAIDTGNAWNDPCESKSFEGIMMHELGHAFKDGSSGKYSINAYLSNGSSFVYHRWLTKVGDYHSSAQWSAGDFDGDGKADLAHMWSDSGKYSFDVYGL